jgi:hypothetical protein
MAIGISLSSPGHHATPPTIEAKTSLNTYWVELNFGDTEITFFASSAEKSEALVKALKDFYGVYDTPINIEPAPDTDYSRRGLGEDEIPIAPANSSPIRRSADV